MKIITGYKGEAHITPNEIQCENQGAFGTGDYVLNIGSKFTPTLISANELQIADGEGVMQGVHFRVDPGTYDTVTIENGTQGMNRKDLIVCRYTKDAGTGVEQTEWVVIKGTPSSGTATRPSPTTGDIRTGATTADMSMFEVVLSGINVTAVNTLFTTLKTMKEMQTDIATNASGISTLNTNLSKWVFFEKTITTAQTADVSIARDIITVVAAQLSGHENCAFAANIFVTGIDAFTVEGTWRNDVAKGFTVRNGGAAFIVVYRTGTAYAYQIQTL